MTTRNGMTTQSAAPAPVIACDDAATARAERQRRRSMGWSRATDGVLDVVVIGGGVSGSAVYRELATRGHRVALLDRGDFAAGTSQASGMLVWGGLLYLKQLDLRTVVELSRARDAMISSAAGHVAPATLRYVSRRGQGAQPWMVRSVTELYWWLGGRRRSRPRRESKHAATHLCRGDVAGATVRFEEGALCKSDARLVLDWLLRAADAHRVALNHAEVTSAHRDGCWRLAVTDRTTSAVHQLRARVVVNAAGVWTDRVAELLAARTKHKHVLSKGVYLGLDRPPDLSDFLAFPTASNGDTQTFTPWGPIALWGPTETTISSLDGGFEPDVDDVRSLLAEANRNLAHPYGPGDVVSLRCGVRPLGVDRAYARDDYSLKISRRHYVDVDPARWVISLYGGKITSAPALAIETADVVARTIEPTGARVRPSDLRPAPENFAFPGLPGAFVDAQHAVATEACATLGDYLRRRTNIAQWSRGHGLWGHADAAGICRELADLIEGPDRAQRAFDALHESAKRERDLLARV